MPVGCSDDKMKWGKNTPELLDSKTLYVCHAEMNAIMFRTTADLKGSIMYVTLCPCNDSAKCIIQSGITKVYYLSDEKGHRPEFIAAKRMFDTAGVQYKQMQPEFGRTTIDFSITNLANNPDPLCCSIEQ